MLRKKQCLKKVLGRITFCNKFWLNLTMRIKPQNFTKKPTLFCIKNYYENISENYFTKAQIYKAKNDFAKAKENFLLAKEWGYTEWIPSSLQFNTYDESGNCIEIVSANASGVAQEKRTYNYDMNVLAENVYYFPNPENKFPTMPQMHNMVTSYEQWIINQNNGELSFAGNFLFSYDEIGDVDVVVCSRSLNGIIPIDEVLCELDKIANKYVVATANPLARFFRNLLFLYN